MRAQPLPVSSPEVEGVDPTAIRSLIDAWEAANVRPYALTIVRHGAVIASASWAPYAPEDRTLKYSLSKTFTASAVGLAVAEGRLSVADRVCSFWPGVTGIGQRAARMTVAHLLSMATGHTSDTYERLDPEDLPGSFLRLEPETEPGSTFCYHNSATLMLSAIVQRLTGEALHTYLRPRLLDPLGIPEIDWLTAGPFDQGFSGLHTTVDAVARLGMTILGRGSFAGQQILAPEWVDAQTTVQVSNGTDPASDWEQGYGYQMWRSKHGWRGDGAFGQLCLVLPEQDMVVAALAQSDEMQGELDAVWQHLLPGVDSGTVHEDRELVADLARLQRPTVRSTVAPVAGRFELTATGPAAHTVAPGGTVLLADGALIADDGHGPVRVPLGDGAWVRSTTVLPDGSSVAVAGTGGWTAPGVLEAHIAPLHSPHVLLVRADVQAGTADMRWQVEPLGSLSLSRSGW